MDFSYSKSDYQIIDANMPNLIMPNQKIKHTPEYCFLIELRRYVCR